MLMYMDDSVAKFLKEQLDTNGAFLGSQRLPEFEFVWHDCPMETKGDAIRCKIHNNASLAALSLISPDAECQEVVKEWTKLSDTSKNRGHTRDVVHFLWPESVHIKHSGRLSKMAQSLVLSKIQAVSHDLNISLSSAAGLLAAYPGVRESGPKWVEEGASLGFLPVERHDAPGGDILAYPITSWDMHIQQLLSRSRDSEALTPAMFDVIKDGANRVFLQSELHPFALDIYRSRSDEELRRLNRIIGGRYGGSYFGRNAIETIENAEKAEDELLPPGHGHIPSSFKIRIGTTDHDVKWGENDALSCLNHPNRASCQSYLDRFAAKSLRELSSGRRTPNKRAAVAYLDNYFKAITAEVPIASREVFERIIACRYPMQILKALEEYVGSYTHIKTAVNLAIAEVPRAVAEYWHGEGLSVPSDISTAERIRQMLPDEPARRIAYACYKDASGLKTMLDDKRFTKEDLEELLRAAITCEEHGYRYYRGIENTLRTQGIGGVVKLASLPPSERLNVISLRADTSARSARYGYASPMMDSQVRKLGVPLGWWLTRVVTKPQDKAIDAATVSPVSTARSDGSDAATAQRRPRVVKSDQGEQLTLL